MQTDILVGLRMSSTKNGIYITIFSLICTLLLVNLGINQSRANPGKGRIPSIFLQDSIRTQTDSLTSDTLAADTVSRKKSALEAPVNYKAEDSIVIDASNIATLYGKGEVTYKDIKLNADYITMKFDSSLVYAEGRPDSIGEIVGTPVFQDKSGQYESSTLQYNFDTEKGYITNIVTQQGEGYLTGGQTKKMKDNEYFMKSGRYTTCDNHECPHFYFQLTKAKVVPKKNIVTGPAYLVLADVPLPLAVPFGFFPFSTTYQSGIIVPTFGDESTGGFYLRDGGYYFAINDHIDLALTGEIYTKGSWGLNAQSAYIKRYKYSGSFNLGYLTTITGDKGMPDYSKQTNFRLMWTHQQDAKANPNMTLSASVNFTTSGYSRNNLNSYYDPGQFTENTKSSTVNMTYNFPNSPFSISTTANITQRTKDSTIAVSFPDFTLSMNRIYPFKRKHAVGSERWYEKISMNYTGLFRNSIETNQDKFLKSNLIKDWKNGMQHNVPISATFSIFKYLNISPSFNFTDRMYTNKIMREWDTQNSRETMDTVYGFYNVYNFQASVSAQTKLYGFYTPLPFLGKKVQAIRHVLTPSLTFSAAPDFSDPRFGSWDKYTYTNSLGEVVEKKYSPFSHGLFGSTSEGKQGVVSLSLGNNLEMKVNRKQGDSIQTKKISLIESFTTGISYNMAADSMNWSNINTKILIKLTKNFNLQADATFDTYTYKLNSSGSPVRVNVPRWKAGKGLGRLSSTGTSFSYTFKNDTFKNWFGGGKKKSNTNSDNETTPNPTEELANSEQPFDNSNPNNNSTERELEDNTEMKFNEDGYMVWEVPWSLSLNYSINVGYGTFNKKKLEYDYKITQSLGFSGTISPTKGWSASFSGNYDFDLKKISYMSCTVNRDLHCWTMGVSFIPVGPYKSYNFNISVKSSLLKDFKYNKRGSPYDQVNWY